MTDQEQRMGDAEPLQDWVPMHVELKGGPNPHEVDILFDGKRPDWCIKSIAIRVEDGKPVTAVIEIDLTTLDVALTGSVAAAEDTAKALKALGWTPPVLQIAGQAVAGYAIGADGQRHPLNECGDFIETEDEIRP